MHPTNVPDRRSDMDETRPHRGGSVDRNLDRLGGSVDGTPTTARRELVKELNASGVELTSGPPGVSLPQAAAEEEGRQGNGGRRASLRPLSGRLLRHRVRVLYRVLCARVGVCLL